jgi:hypothetical protein
MGDMQTGDFISLLRNISGEYTDKKGQAGDLISLKNYLPTSPFSLLPIK